MRHKPQTRRASAAAALCLSLLGSGCAPTIAGSLSTDEVEEPGPVDTGGGGEAIAGTYRLFINEIMASNANLALDPDDDTATPDWFELHNPNDIDIELAGFTVTDDLSDPGMHTLGDLVLPANGYLVLLADDGTGGIHLSFKLSGSSDAIGLYDPNGVPLDQVEYSDLGDNQVAGRHPDDGPLVLLSEPTPGESNDSASILEP